LIEELETQGYQFNRKNRELSVRTKFMSSSPINSIADSVGNIELLGLPKTAFLCSRKVTAGIILKCYEWAVEQRENERCIISGFHSTIERDVLHYLLKGKQPIIVALHRGIGPAIEKKWANELKSERLLVISPFERSRKRGGSNEAQIRNRLMIELADEVVVGYTQPGGNLSRIIQGFAKQVRFIG
jgi:predicted Rossmann fold nucleotide-binding protein DprA/Smf involved in DNA uptake